MGGLWAHPPCPPGYYGRHLPARRAETGARGLLNKSNTPRLVVCIIYASFVLYFCVSGIQDYIYHELELMIPTSSIELN